MTLLEDPRSYPEVDGWIDVCAFDDLLVDRGVAALVGTTAVAIFRCSPDDEVLAIANIDPYSHASVLSRGMVGCVDDRCFVASPVFKNRFDLRTGISLRDHDVRVECHDVQISGGRVFVSAAPASSSDASL